LGAKVTLSSSIYYNLSVTLKRSLGAAALTVCCITVAGCASTSSPAPREGAAAGVNLVDLLPSGGPFTPVGKPRTAHDARTLFAAINGGAEVYLGLGFTRAAFQTYTVAPGRKVRLEVYQMKDNAAARAMYARRAGDEGKAAGVGEVSVFKGYFLIFVDGPLLVAAAAHDVKGTTLAHLLPLARAVRTKLAGAAGE